MKVYIIYDRYEHNEWFSVDYIGTRKSESIKQFKEKCLPEFLEYGPDDCHSYQLQVVNMTKIQYEQLLEWYNNPKMSLESGPYYDFMCEVYEQCDWSDTGNVLMSTDGCSEYSNIVRYYGMVVKGKDSDEVNNLDWMFTDEYNEYYEELMNDNDLFERMCKEYIKYNF
jgi:hypothetical protein